jgi:hypothetical protein
MPMLPFRIESLITTRKETWKASIMAAGTFSTSYSEYWTKIAS